MKQILLATAAAAALLFAPVLASAQYPSATPSITTPEAATTAPSTASGGASTMQAPMAQAGTTEMPTASPQTMPSVTAQSSPYSARTQTYGAASTAPSTTPSTAVAAEAGAAPGSSTYDSSTSGAPQTAAFGSPQARGQLISDSKALELAQAAGMQAAPMSAAAVCQPRSLDLMGGATHDNRNALEFAVDRASVCELQEIELPARGAASFRQALLRQGVDESKIVAGESGSSEVRMTFAGVATSSDQYAAIFNPMRTAANAASPGASQSMSYAPSSAPATTAPSAAAPTPEGAADEPATHDHAASPTQ